mgnify:CR=1 FL=1|tara:strand:- start:3909 stop:5735 length:1827 start_codon:yes stop_codon:yes gene_type:complete
MAIGYNGNVSWGIVPKGPHNGNISGSFWDYRNNVLKSVNDPLRYELQWTNGAGLTELTEPSTANWTGGSSTTAGNGDIVSIVFKVYTTTDYDLPIGDWNLIGTIRKSRDIVNKSYLDDTPPQGHRFTIDVSKLVADELSYSLCPINKGTWQNPFYGGMNGGLTMQDNVLSGNSAMGTPVSSYNVSKNGSFRHLKVEAGYEVINGEGQIKESTYSNLTSSIITVINSVNQFEKDGLYYATRFLHDKDGVGATNLGRFNTRCPNWYYNTTTNKVALNKKVRMDEEAEWLQWYVEEPRPGVNPDPTERYNKLEIYGTTYLANGSVQNNFVLVDFNSLLKDNATTPTVLFSKEQNRMLIQNVSPAFINANAFSSQAANRPYTIPTVPITATTHRYCLYFRGYYFNNTATPPAWEAERHSSVNWFEIDREDENIPYGFVRFHWLNSVGGIDSYTAKRDVVEGLTINRGVIERKSGDRTWYQDDRYGDGSGAVYNTANSAYHSDTMRGGDIYKGGREVINVNAERTQSVYTEPLNKIVAKWLEEIMLSPNVWIEMDTDATKVGNLRNPYLRPSTKEYIPVIITNSDIETVNQAEELVKFNIEYTLAHKVITQRN